MTKLTWGDLSQRLFEAGVDRGVLQVNSASAAVAWAGLISVNESPLGGAVNPTYIDGVKIDDDITYEEFSCNIEAYTYPAEFDQCNGALTYEPSGGSSGLTFSSQQRKRFDFSYRTLIGDANQGLDYGYKIHFVYNAMATPSKRVNSSLTSDPDASTLSWDISTIPVHVNGIRPTAHVYLDSRYTNKTLLSVIEAYLYGADGIEPTIPSLQSLYSLMTSFSGFSRNEQVNLKSNLDLELNTVINEARIPSFENTGLVDSIYYPFNCTTSETLQWASSGSRSIYINPMGTSQGTSSSSRLVVAASDMLERGKTYRASVVVRSGVSTPLESGAYVRSLCFIPQNGTIIYSSAPKEAGEYRLSISFTTPTTGNFNLYLFNGGMEGDRGIYFDSLIITEGFEDLPFFDGNSEGYIYNGEQTQASWLGATNASKSKITYSKPLPETANPRDAYIKGGRLMVFEGGSWVDYGVAPSIG